MSELNNMLLEIRKLKYNPFIKSKHTNQLEIEKQQIPILTIYNDGILLNYKIGNYNISKSILNNKYSLLSIINLCNVDKNTIIKFINSQRFNFILQQFDNSYKIPQYIYFIKFTDGVKIGRTFDIKQRYNPSKLYNSVLRVVSVNDVSKCEKELKNKFKEKYDLVKGLEKFNIDTNNEDTLRKALRTFDDIINKYKKEDNKQHKTEHIEFVKTKSQDIKIGYYVSSLVASIIINIFADADFDNIYHVLKLIDKASDKFDKNNYYSTFIEGNERFFYWSYYGYKVIANGTRKLINASRLWKTIKETDKNKSKEKLNEFLKSKFISRLIEENTDIKPISFSYKDRPLLNGKYLPVYFTHFIIQHLDAKYAIEVAKQMTETLFEEQNKLSNSTAIKGGDIDNNFVVSSERDNRFDNSNNDMINILLKEASKIPHKE